MAAKPNYASEISSFFPYLIKSEQTLFLPCSFLKPDNGSIVFKDILVNSRSSVKMLNILKSSVPESRDHAKPLSLYIYIAQSISFWSRCTEMISENKNLRKK